MDSLLIFIQLEVFIQLKKIMLRDSTIQFFLLTLGYKSRELYSSSNRLVRGKGFNPF